MPDRVEVQDLTCQPGVTVSSPTEVDIDNVVDCQVIRVTIRISSGHAGLTGIALGYAHNPVLPRTTGRFISGDDEIIEYDLSNYDAGPQWSAFLVNADTIAHSWEVRFEVDELSDAGAFVIPGPVSPVAIHQAAGASVGAG